MTSSELVGQDPCVGCETGARDGCLAGHRDVRLSQTRACGPYAAHAARKELVERLKGLALLHVQPTKTEQGCIGGYHPVFVDDGWLVWIGEDK